jgi:hypothetical protein
MKKCTKCQTENPTHANFCRLCGEHFNDIMIQDESLRPVNYNDFEEMCFNKIFEAIFNYYEEKIAANIDINTSNVLLTHHVPDEKLNAHEANWYGFYSGSKDLIRRLNFPKRYMNYAICGHTHKEVKGQLYDNFCGVNVGSDYGKLSYYILELPNVINKLSL